jgi:hypothetical protein
VKKIKQLFVVLVSLGLLASLCLNWSRHQVEQANRSMETVMDYQALVRMADSEGLSRQSVFKKFKDAGVTTLAVSDRTIMDMAGEGLVTYYTGGELLRQKEIGGLSPGRPLYPHRILPIRLSTWPMERAAAPLMPSLKHWAPVLTGTASRRSPIRPVSTCSRLRRPSIRILSARTSWASRKRP